MPVTGSVATAAHHAPPATPGRIARRLLVHDHSDPEAIAALLPAPLRPHLHHQVSELCRWSEALRSIAFRMPDAAREPDHPLDKRAQFPYI